MRLVMNINESKYHKISSYKNKKFLGLLTTIKNMYLKMDIVGYGFVKQKQFILTFAPVRVAILLVFFFIL